MKFCISPFIVGRIYLYFPSFLWIWFLFCCETWFDEIANVERRRGKCTTNCCVFVDVTKCLSIEKWENNKISTLLIWITFRSFSFWWLEEIILFLFSQIIEKNVENIVQDVFLSNLFWRKFSLHLPPFCMYLCFFFDISNLILMDTWILCFRMFANENEIFTGNFCFLFVQCWILLYLHLFEWFWFSFNNFRYNYRTIFVLLISKWIFVNLK